VFVAEYSCKYEPRNGYARFKVRILAHSVYCEPTSLRLDSDIFFPFGLVAPRAR
jgi:hypothetical protein